MDHVAKRLKIRLWIEIQGQNHNNSIGVMIPLFTGSESVSRINNGMKIRLQIRIQGRKHNTSNLNHMNGSDKALGEDMGKKIRWLTNNTNLKVKFVSHRRSAILRLMVSSNDKKVMWTNEQSSSRGKKKIAIISHNGRKSQESSIAVKAVSLADSTPVNLSQFLTWLTLPDSFASIRLKLTGNSSWILNYMSEKNWLESSKLTTLIAVSEKERNHCVNNVCREWQRATNV